MKNKPVILVVDDQPHNIKLLEEFLVRQGYEVIPAESGEEALAGYEARQNHQSGHNDAIDEDGALSESPNRHVRDPRRTPMSLPRWRRRAPRVWSSTRSI